MSNNINIRQMLEAGVHFGHQMRFWNPKIAPYIFGSKNKIHIIDLEKTLVLYRQAVNFLGSIAAKKGKILFVGTKQQARNLVRDEATRCQMPYVNYRWLGGMLTNYKTIRQSLKRLRELEELRDSHTFSRITKKESLAVTREISKLERSLGGIRNMGGLPDAIFVIDVKNENIVVSEAMKLRIPIVGIVDTNSSPDGIDYVIPGNDDSMRAIQFYLQGIADTIIEARSGIMEEEAMEEKREFEKRVAKKETVTKNKVYKKKIDKGEQGGEFKKSTKPIVTKVKAEKVTVTKVHRIQTEDSKEEKEPTRIKRISTGTVDNLKFEE